MKKQCKTCDELFDITDEHCRIYADEAYCGECGKFMDELDLGLIDCIKREIPDETEQKKFFADKDCESIKDIMQKLAAVKYSKEKTKE